MAMSWLQVLRAVLAITMITVALPADAGQPVDHGVRGGGPMASDVALGAGGVFSGRLVGVNRTSLAGVAVTLSGRERGATAITQEDGTFRFVGLRGGTYQVAFLDTSQTLRLWSAGTAPPSAQPAVQLATGPPTLRGQSPPFRTGRQFYAAAAVAGLVGVGWAVWEAIDKETPPGS